MRLEIKDPETVEFAKSIGKTVWLLDGHFNRPPGLRRREVYCGLVVGVEAVLRRPVREGALYLDSGTRATVRIAYTTGRRVRSADVMVWLGSGDLYPSEAEAYRAVVTLLDAKREKLNAEFHAADRRYCHALHKYARICPAKLD